MQASRSCRDTDIGQKLVTKTRERIVEVFYLLPLRSNNGPNIGKHMNRYAVRLSKRDQTIQERNVPNGASGSIASQIISAICELRSSIGPRKFDL